MSPNRLSQGPAPCFRFVRLGGNLDAALGEFPGACGPRSVEQQRRQFAGLLVRAAGLGAPVRTPLNPLGALGSKRRHDQPLLMSRTILHSKGHLTGFAEKVAGGDRPMAGNVRAGGNVGGRRPGTEQGHRPLALPAQQIQRGIRFHVSYYARSPSVVSGAHLFSVRRTTCGCNNPREREHIEEVPSGAAP